MKLTKLFILTSFTLFGFSAFSQTAKTLDIYFYEQPHMFFKTEKSSDYNGIEADILKEFFKWCSEKKKINVTPKYHSYKSFDEFYKAMGMAPENAIGAGTVTINEERKANFDFSAPYLKNVSVLVSHGSVPTFSSDMPKVGEQPAGAASTSLSSRSSSPQPVASFDYSTLALVALVERGSVHSSYMKRFIGNYLPNTKMEGVSGNLSEILASDPKYIAYMDIITYRELFKNSNKYFKIHRDFTMKGENFGFILPKKSEWTPLINEFMESGFGFTATRKYQTILENYLGYELINTVDMF